MNSLREIVAPVTVLVGALWLLWPGLLRGWLVGKTSWAIYWALAGLYGYPAASWAAARWGFRAWVWSGIVLVILGGVLRMTLDRVAQKIPEPAYRLIGALTLLQGAMTLYQFKRSAP